MNDPVLTVAEVAHTLRCSRSRVFELLADGTLQRAPKFGRKTVVLADSVYAALNVEAPAPARPSVRTARRSLAEDAAAVLAKARAR